MQDTGLNNRELTDVSSTEDTTGGQTQRLLSIREQLPLRLQRNRKIGIEPQISPC